MLVSLLQLLSFGKQWFFYILFLIRLRGFRYVLEWQPHLSSQVREFEENGVVLLRGVIPEWVPGQIFFACLKQTKHELKIMCFAQMAKYAKSTKVCCRMNFQMSEVPYLKQVTLHQMDHPQVTAVLTSLRTFFSMDYVQAGLFLTNQGYLDFWYSSCIAQLVAKLKGSKEVRLIVDQLNVNPYLPPSLGLRRLSCRWHMVTTCDNNSWASLETEQWNAVDMSTLSHPWRRRGRFTEPEKFHTDVRDSERLRMCIQCCNVLYPLKSLKNHQIAQLFMVLKARKETRISRMPCSNHSEQFSQCRDC